MTRTRYSIGDDIFKILSQQQGWTCRQRQQMHGVQRLFFYESKKLSIYAGPAGSLRNSDRRLHITEDVPDTAHVAALVNDADDILAYAYYFVPGIPGKQEKRFITYHFGVRPDGQIHTSPMNMNCIPPEEQKIGERSAAEFLARLMLVGTKYYDINRNRPWEV